MTQTLRSLIQTLERAASQSPKGDRTEVLVEVAGVRDPALPDNLGSEKTIVDTVGSGLAAGARYDTELDAIVIETSPADWA